MRKHNKKALHEQIKELEELGYEVDIEHRRKYELKEKLHDGLILLEEEVLCAKGGTTIAYIFKGDDAASVGYADCSKHENYNRKIGASIALGRARKSLGV